MSRYTPKQYAAALFQSLEATKPSNRDATIKKFASIVVKNYDRSLVPKIAMQLKKLERAKAGRHEVVLTSARQLEKSVISEIKARVGSSSTLTELIDPDVLGGVKILINDELVIDGTYKTRIARMVEAVVKAAQ